MKVMLKYMFIFDPAKTWTSTEQFNNTFAKYLESIGLEAEIVQTEEDIAEQLNDEHILLIKEKDGESKRETGQ